MGTPRTIQAAFERGYHLHSRRADLKVGDTVEVLKAKCYRPYGDLANSVPDFYDRLTIKIASKRDLEYISPDFP